MKKKKSGKIEKAINSIFQGFLNTDDLYMNTPVAYLADIKKLKEDVLRAIKIANINFPEPDKDYINKTENYNKSDFVFGLVGYLRRIFEWKEDWLLTKKEED